MPEYYDMMYRSAGNHYDNWSWSQRLRTELVLASAIQDLIDMGYEVKIEKVYA